MTNEEKLLLLSQEEFAQREPLTTRLRGLVRSYPKGVGLVQEFIQNADDAGAREVHVFLDERSHRCSKLPSPSMSELQGPAFVVVNDAQFSPDDWKNIQQIGESGKALQTTKTGRFGLGFNSVYNVTDFPMLLTGARIGVFDPHGQTVFGASVDKPGSAWRLTTPLWAQCSDLLTPFQLFGLKFNATEFDGTIFRLPIRTETRAAKSEICQQPFTASDFYAIVDKLKQSLPDLLLFLRSVHKIGISVVDPVGQLTPLLSVETLDRDPVDLARERIREALSLPYDKLFSLLSEQSSSPIVSEYDHELQVTNQEGDTERIVYRVVSGLFGDPTGELAACAQKMRGLNEKAVPLAGAAARLRGRDDDPFHARLFCTLPLPSASPLGFCHLNGFFDLQADRQGLFQDTGSEGSSAVRVAWNRLLLKHCCAEAAAQLCQTLTERALAGGRDLYEHWPRIPEEEQSLSDSLPRHVYERLTSRSCLPAGGSSAWKRPHEVLVPVNKLPDELKQALLSDTFLITNPTAPGFVVTGFKAAGVSLSFLSPSFIRKALKVAVGEEWELVRAPRPCLREKEWILALLVYCASDRQLDELVGVPLALTADGKLRVFGKSRNVFLGGEEERSILSKRPDWFLDVALEDAFDSAGSARAKVFTMTAAGLVANLHLALPKIETDGKVSAADQGAPDETWISQVFDYLARHADQVSLNQDLIRKLPIVPDQQGYLHAMGSANTPLLPGSDDLKSFLTALSHLGVPFVSGSEKLMKAVRRFCERFPEIAIWPLTPIDLVDTLHVLRDEWSSESRVPSLKHATAILDFLSSRRSVRDLKAKPDRIPKLTSLPLFPTTTTEIVSLTAEERFIPAGYPLPRFAADVGLLATGKDNNWVALYQALGVQKLTRSRLIMSIVLPRLNELHEADQHRLLAWLRANLPLIRETEDAGTAATLIAKLSDVLPVQCADGKARPPRLLYHPESDFAAALLGSRIGFPSSAIYHDRPELWLEFFETLGMERLLRPDDIISALDDVIASEVPEKDRADRLNKVAEYVDLHWDVLRDKTVFAGVSGANVISFCEALKQRSWLPALTSPPRDYPPRLLPKWEKQLFQPSELLARAALPLASSVRPICQTNRISQMQSDIGLPSGPNLTDVLGQLENLSTIVSTSEDKMSERVAGVFTDIYAFLGRYFEEISPDELDRDSRVLELRDRFKHIPCILDGSFTLWEPRLCFSEPVSSFLGSRTRVRAESVLTDRGLFVLGRRERPEVTDYLAFFSELFLMQGGAPISDDDRVAVRSAYLSAALLANSTEYRGYPILLENGALTDGKAVFDNAPWISERARRAGLVFVDPNLSLNVIRAFGVSLLSSAVYEKAVEEHPSVNSEFASTCAELEGRLRATLFHKGVCRLARAAGGAATVKAIGTFFGNMRVVPVSTLTTALVWTDSGARIEGSTGESDLVFDPERNALVVSEDAGDVLFERIGSILSYELRYDGHDLKEFATYLVAILRVPPEEIENRLTKLRVPQLFDESEHILHEIDIDTTGEYIDESLGWQDEVAATPPDAATSKDPDPSTSKVTPLADLSKTDSRSDDRAETPGEMARQDGNAQEPQASTPASNRTSDWTHERATTTPVHSSRETAVRGDTSKSGAENVWTIGTQARQKSRSEGANPHRGRARTYVVHSAETERQDTEEAKEHRSRVDKAAVRKVMELEEKKKRTPKEMPHTNKGYDIESYAEDGRIERYIEVKGLSGPWSELGVAVSREQFRKAQKEAGSFYLYVVEFALEPDRARAYSIQDPANKVDEFWFDNGWIGLAKAYGEPEPADTIVEGSAVIVDGVRRAVITGIHRRGALMLLELEYDDGSKDKLVYSHHRIQVGKATGIEAGA